MNVKVTTIIEINAGAGKRPISGKPTSLTFQHEEANWGDNARFYGNYVRDALEHALAAAVNDVTEAWPPV